MQLLSNKVDNTAGSTGLLTAGEFNQAATEQENTITASGQTLTPLDLQQQSRSLSIHAAGADYYVDSGTANNYDLSISHDFVSPESFLDGMRIRFIPSNSNTGASSVVVGAAGQFDVVNSDGDDIQADEIQAGSMTVIEYSDALNGFILQVNAMSQIGLQNLTELREVNPTTNRQIYTLLGKGEEGVSSGLYYYDELDTTSQEDLDCNIVVTNSGARLKSLSLFQVEDLEISNCHNFQKVWQKTNANVEDVFVMLIGDSTSNAITEWGHLLYMRIAEEVNPAYTVVLRRWDHITDTGFLPDETVVNGTGSNTLYLYNLSIPGDSYTRWIGSEHQIGFEGNDFDVIIPNYGHNHGTNAGYFEQLGAFSTLVCSLRAHQPNAEIILSLQNPRFDALEQTAATNDAVRDVAAIYGCGILDGYTPFVSLINQGIDVRGTLYIDDIHPNDDANMILASSKFESIRPNLDVAYTTDNQILNNSRMPLLNNPFFSVWAAGSPLPDDWSINSVTIERDQEVLESGAFSLKMTALNTGGQQQITQDVSQFAPLLKTRHMTLVARVLPSSPDPDSNSGRMTIQTDSGVFSSQASGGGKGDWQWRVFTIPQQETATLRVSLLAGDVGDTVNVDRVGLFTGKAASEIAPDGVIPELENYYTPNNVTLVRNAGGVVQFDGDLTVNGNEITYTNPQSGQSRFAINLAFLEAGANYEITYTDNLGGNNTILAHRDSVNGSGGTVVNLTTNSANGVNTFTFTPTSFINSLLFFDGGGDDIDVTINSIARL